MLLLILHTLLQTVSVRIITVEEINKMVGSDTLGYLSVEHVQQLAIHSKCGFCTGCFTGKYPVTPPTETMDIVYDKPLSVSNPNKKL